MDPDAIEEKITEKTRGILPVHLYGNAVEMDRVLAIAEKHNLFVLEDASQAHDAEFRGQKVGTFGHASCFSFYPSKNMTFCGDGGITVTNDPALAEKVKMLRNHGRKDKYTHDLFGFNMRANEIQAAVGLVQLKHLPEFTKKRQQAARWYHDLLQNVSAAVLPREKEYISHVHHLYVVRVERREEIMSYLKDRGICTGIHYPVPCHMQPAVTRNFGRVSLPRTEEYCKKILSLPIFPTITEEQVHYVAQHFALAVNQ